MSNFALFFYWRKLKKVANKNNLYATKRLIAFSNFTQNFVYIFKSLNIQHRNFINRKNFTIHNLAILSRTFFYFFNSIKNRISTKSYASPRVQGLTFYVYRSNACRTCYCQFLFEIFF